MPHRGHVHSWLFPARATLPRKPGLPLHHCNSYSLLWVATSVPNTHPHAFPCVLQRLAHIVTMGVTRLCRDYNRKTSRKTNRITTGRPALRPSRQGLFSYPSPCPQHLALHTTDGRQSQQNVQNTDGWMDECINTHKQTHMRGWWDRGRRTLASCCWWPLEAIFPFQPM